MFQLNTHPSGRHFLQIPGPTNVPDRVLQAMNQPTIDHRGPGFARLTLEILDGLKGIFQTAGWGLEVLCRNPDEYSGALTAVMMPDGHDADAFRRDVLAHFDMSLGTGLGKLAGRVFRIGHLGFFNDLMLCGTLCGVEMGLALRHVPHRRNGIGEALTYLRESGAQSAAQRHAA